MIIESKLRVKTGVGKEFDDQLLASAKALDPEAKWVRDRYSKGRGTLQVGEGFSLYITSSIGSGNELNIRRDLANHSDSEAIDEATDILSSLITSLKDVCDMGTLSTIIQSPMTWASGTTPNF